MGLRRKSVESGFEHAQLAKDLAEIAEQEIADLMGSNSNVSAGIDAIADRLRAHGLQAAIQRMFDALSPEEQFKVLADRFDDEEIRRSLATRHEMLKKQAERRAAEEYIMDEARGCLRIDLARIPIGMTVQLTLHSMCDYEEVQMNLHELRTQDYTPDATFVFARHYSGNFQVIEYAGQGANPDAPHLTDAPRLQEVVGLGTGNAETHDPAVYLGGPVSFARSSEDWQPFSFFENGKKGPHRPGVLNHVVLGNKLVELYDGELAREES